LAEKDDVEEPLSHGEHSPEENVINCHSKSGLTMKLVVRLAHDLFGDFDKLTSVKERFFKLLVLVLGVPQLEHLSLEDHGGEIDVIVAYFESFFMLLFFTQILFFFVNQVSKSIDNLISLDIVVIKLEIIDESGTLIRVQFAINLFDRESGCTGSLIQELIEIVAVVVVKHGLKIHDDKIVVVLGSWLFIDMLKDILNGQSSFIHSSVSQDSLEIEVQRVD